MSCVDLHELCKGLKVGSKNPLLWSDAAGTDDNESESGNYGNPDGDGSENLGEKTRKGL